MELDTNLTIISGRIFWVDEHLRCFQPKPTDYPIYHRTVGIENRRQNGKGELQKMRIFVTVWSISTAQDALMQVSNQVQFTGQLKWNVYRSRFDVTVKGDQPNAVTLINPAQSESIPVNELADLLRSMGVDIPDAIAADFTQAVASARMEQVNPAPPETEKPPATPVLA